MRDDPPHVEACHIDGGWARVHRLADGTRITVRMLRAEDRDAFVAGFERLSPRSRYFRFFTPMPRLPESLLRRLLGTDGIDHVALAAWRDIGNGTIEPVGVARFVRLGDGADTADAAVAVVDHMQARGVGRLLLADLCEAARERGIRRFRAEVMLENRGVAALLHEFDADAKPLAVEGDIAVYQLDVPSDTADGAAESFLFRMLRSVARDTIEKFGPNRRGKDSKMRAFIVSLFFIMIAIPSIAVAHGDTPEHGSVAIIPRADRRATVTELPAVECSPCTDDGDGSGSVTDDAETPAPSWRGMTRPDAE